MAFTFFFLDQPALDQAVRHTLPIHSADSVCLYCKKEGLLFSEDTHLRVQDQDSEYPTVFAYFLEFLLSKPPSIIYQGHVAFTHEGIQTMLRHSLQNIKNSPVAIRRPSC